MSLLIPINSRYRPCCYHNPCCCCWLRSISTSCNMLNYAVKSLMSKYAVIGLRIMNYAVKSLMSKYAVMSLEIMILPPSSFCILQRRHPAWLLWILLIEILHNISYFCKVAHIILSFILWMSQRVFFSLDLKLHSAIPLPYIQNVINFPLFIALDN